MLSAPPYFCLRPQFLSREHRSGQISLQLLQFGRDQRFE
jgi:hypothetical protein